MSTSKKVELKNHSTTGETPFRVAMANGEYIKQIDLDIVDNKHMDLTLHIMEILHIGG